MNKEVQDMQMFMIKELSEPNLEASMELIMELLDFGQRLCRQTQQVGEQLCQEVMHITQGKARLLLSFLSSSTEQVVTFPVSVSFKVQFNNRSYGTLDIVPDVEHPTSPALPLALAQLLAHVCGMLLYNIELSLLIEGQSQRLDQRPLMKLTRRERQVLELICRGYNQETIATMLGIMPATVETHRKRLCGKLGVHSERDIPLAAYQANLFSILKK